MEASVVLAILGMKMRRFVIIEVHVDHNSVEGADPWHWAKEAMGCDSLTLGRGGLTKDHEPGCQYPIHKSESSHYRQANPKPSKARTHGVNLAEPQHPGGFEHRHFGSGSVALIGHISNLEFQVTLHALSQGDRPQRVRTRRR